MKIIVDAFGGDNAPLEILRGCELAVQEYGFEILLTGREEEIRKVASDNGISLRNMEICPAEEVISMMDDAMSVLKTKKDSSMAVGLRKLSEGAGDAFVSAGNSGALVTGATMLVKRIRGVRRVAFAPVLPKNKGFFMLIDSGANSECRPEMLRQFGIMGSAYMEKVMGIEKPRVGLVNVGTEEHKGNEFTHAAYALLKDCGINFIGNIEARDIPDDAADVVVTDGFTGNVILKLYEGAAMTVMRKVKKVLTKNLKTKLAAAIVRSNLNRLKAEMDYNTYGGAPVMGTKKPVFKVHGSATAVTVKNALRLTKLYVEGDVIGEITQELSALSAGEAEE